jgi:hypothetical protein
MNKNLEALRQIKMAFGASNETLAALTNYQLSAQQIQSILEGCEELQSTENLSLIEKGLLDACMLPVENIKANLLEVLNNHSSNLTSIRLHT